MIVGRNVQSRAYGRRFAGDTAREILGQAGFGRSREAIFLTAGQFSSIDWIDAVLDYTGPANATIATWTAATADLERVEKWLDEEDRLQSCAWLVDRSFPNRQPAICDAFRAKFGDDAVRVFATHAKFTLLWNDAGWRVVCLTSANLNLNKRSEFFHVADDPDLFDMFKGMVDVVFEEQAATDGFETDAAKRKPFDKLQQIDLFERTAREGGVGVAARASLK